MGSLSATESCLYLSDYDIEKALKYYWEEDFLLVQEAIKVKSACDSQRSLIALEASMYGFGGKYADDAGGSSANENVIDLSDPGAKDAFAGEKVGHAFEKLSRYGVVANVIYAVAGAMKSMVASTTEFEDSMKSIQAITLANL